MAPGTGPVTAYIECAIRMKAKDIQVSDGKWEIQWMLYCFRCNVWIDPNAPHVPLLDSTRGSLSELC